MNKAIRLFVGLLSITALDFCSLAMANNNLHTTFSLKTVANSITTDYSDDLIHEKVIAVPHELYNWNCRRTAQIINTQNSSLNVFCVNQHNDIVSGSVSCQSDHTDINNMYWTISNDQMTMRVIGTCETK